MAAAVAIENVSKRYRIATTAKRLPYRTLRDDLVSLASWPLRRIRGDANPTDDFFALRDVSLEVPTGEVVGIIGRNGAGKSTLLKILGRITKPTAGCVRLRGRVGSLLEIGTGFHPELTGRENIFLCGAVLGMRRAEIHRKFEEIVAFAEIDQFLDTPVKRYSSGMFMRLAFAVMAHLEPEILLVDEVLAVGDAAFQKKCLGKMDEVARGGRTVLFVSHNMTAVANLCRRAIWLDRGGVRADGPVRPVLAEYAAAGGGEVTRQEWTTDTAPAGENVRLVVAAVEPTNGDVPFTVRTELRLEFEFAVTAEYAELNFSIVLNELQRGCVFNTGSPTVAVSHGRVRGSFVIPGNLLNDGLYSVRVLLVRDTSVALFDRADILTFQVHDVERTGNWYGEWIGAVRPAFEWTVRATP